MVLRALDPQGNDCATCYTEKRMCVNKKAKNAAAQRGSFRWAETAISAGVTKCASDVSASAAGSARG